MSHTKITEFQNQKCLVKLPILNLHESPDNDAPFVSQGIYGQLAYLIKQKENWGLIEIDGYRGWGQINGLTLDKPIWRTAQNLYKVTSKAGLVYPIADTIKPALMHLPFGAFIKLKQPLEKHNNRWVEVELINEQNAWMQRGDLEKSQIKPIDSLTTLSQKFLGLPYIWGGTSSEGYDCSGFIQALFKQAGLLLPRDSKDQCDSDLLQTIDKPQQPGDLIFFGEEKVSHVGLYIGEDQFIHAGVRDNGPKIDISTLSTSNYPYLFARRAIKASFSYKQSPITTDIKNRMQYSWNKNAPVHLDDLAYISLSHLGFDNCVHSGEIIIHKSIAKEVVEIFAELYQKNYPIEKMKLIDEYEALDSLSCMDNNTSCFCFRTITGKTSELSTHSYGLAIDINPLLNPYQKDGVVIPENGKEFLDRKLNCRGMIKKGDCCHKAFITRGWKWGGDWLESRGYVDYHHFYKEL